VGTNFYWRERLGEDDLGLDDPRVHIGKRSGAGYYCWDCDESLHELGIEGIHTGIDRWLDACPRCGKRKTEGPEPVRDLARLPVGVAKCCSFTWSASPRRVRAVCAAQLDTKIVVDENGLDFTGREFLEMLALFCPIEVHDAIGTRFS
jgi:hypothetical protein